MERSILVDFYNLGLDLTGIAEPNWRVPEADRKKIIEFFEKYAPEVLRYRTAAEIEALPKPIDGFEIIGTLGYFEYRRKQSWFDSDAFNFYVDFKKLRELVDLYFDFEGKDIPDHIPDHLDAWIRSLPDSVRIRAHRIEGENGKVSYTEQLVAVTSTSSDPLKVQFALGKMRYQLWRGVISLVNGETEIRKCEAEGCDKIFIPMMRGKEQQYCSERCRNRIAQRRFREKREK